MCSVEKWDSSFRPSFSDDHFISYVPRKNCQAQIDMSAFSHSRHVRFYVLAAAWLVRSGRRRVRHGWSGLGVTGPRGR